MASGLAAVSVFFLISGYLVTLSWLQTASAGEFVLKRVARIYPGYLAAFAFSFLVGLSVLVHVQANTSWPLIIAPTRLSSLLCSSTGP